MAHFGDARIRTREDLARFEAEMTLGQRLPERSILDVFAAGAARHPTATAITMLMTGAPDEQPRRVDYGQLLGMIRGAANMFSALGGPAPGVACMLPSLVETYATLWGAETAGYAVPINFLLPPDSIAELLRASGAKILVALGPHPQLDIWEKALALRDQVPGLILVRVSPPGTPLEDGVIDFGAALPYTEVDVLHLNADGTLGEACAPDEIGVITVRGPHVSPGYLDPKQNRGVFDDGRLNSGDLDYKDAQGRLYVSGRSKDLIIRSGHNIDPAMIENAMSTHPAVALAAAVGMPDAYAGELPVCFVELRAGFSVSDEEPHAHARASIDERPAWPKQILVVDSVPLTTVGKIYKPSLRCEAARMRVADLVRIELGLPTAGVDVMDGGARGMRVTVTLSETDRPSAPAVEKALAAFLFEAKVQ